ncbi:hypothetical protein QFZ75_003341 [Streptomyces sp. V3I8]|uniref:hypothetical protein n=1 Tax=Streptomyces sp. V3I8 TaxID=3042279 RepID=UPI00277E8605|nr:hypothetical protein [Streptomyces sp. V3I8]MDQ1036925.1 hypothetical protein [Streptomyces sp. V3I8]
MSDQTKDTDFTTQDNGMPAPPAKDPAVATPNDNGMPTPPAEDPVAVPLDNGMPTPPAPVDVLAMDNGMPSPPALDLGGAK